MLALNSAFSFLTFTTELQSDYIDGYMPTLDLKAKLADNKLNFQFFEKPTTSRYCVMEKSAMGDQSKISILTQEVNRRLANTSEDQPQHVRDRILNDFVDKMEYSGYNTDTRRLVVRRGIIRYETFRELELKGVRRLHRPAWSTEKERAMKKLTGKEDWYKSKKSESSQSEEIMTLKTGSHMIRKKGMRRQTRQSVQKKEYEPAAVLFIRRTPGGTLVNQLRKEEEKLWPVLGHRLKLVEKCGTKLKSLLWKADP